jgi:hypothetical protein
VRSTHENFVKSSGLRWACAMLLVEIPRTTRVLASPFLSALAPSERYAAKRDKRHKKIIDWAWQLLFQVRRWYPEREIVAVADSAYASLKLLFRCRSSSGPVTFICQQPTSSEGPAHRPCGTYWAKERAGGRKAEAPAPRRGRYLKTKLGWPHDNSPREGRRTGAMGKVKGRVTLSSRIGESGPHPWC